MPSIVFPYDVCAEFYGDKCDKWKCYDYTSCCPLTNIHFSFKIGFKVLK